MSTRQPPQRVIAHKAADIDTTLPYQNVKAAVKIFGEIGDARKPKSDQRHGSINALEVQQLREELAAARAHLSVAEKDRATALLEVEGMRKCLEAAQVLDPILDDGQQVINELETLRKEKSKLEGELSIALKEKEDATKQAEEALAVAEVSAKRAEELSMEISGTKESLVLVKRACIEANKEKQALLAAARRSDTSNSLQAVESPASNKLEQRFTMAGSELTMVDLRLVRINLIAARDVLSNIDKLKAGQGSPVMNATIFMELEAVKSEINKAINNDTIVQSMLRELQGKLNELCTELDATKEQLVAIRTKEELARAEVGLLTRELERVLGALKSTVSCNQAFLGLSRKLQEMAALEGCDANGGEEVRPVFEVADEAKAELKAMLKEATKVALQAELCQYEGHVSEEAEPEMLRSSSQSLPEVAVNGTVLSSNKEEQKKKKLALPSISRLLRRRSKRYD